MGRALADDGRTVVVALKAGRVIAAGTGLNVLTWPTLSALYDMPAMVGGTGGAISIRFGD